MPPLTPEEIENDETLDSKLGAFFESEMADTAPEAPAAEQDEVADEEAAAEAAETPDETGDEDGQPRDEQGRFAAKDDEPRLFAGKYKSEEELEQAYLHLQSLQGKSSQELGELRRIVEEIQSRQQTPQQYGNIDWESAVDQNPVRAAEAALQTGDEYALAQVREAWELTSPGSYELWAGNKRLEIQMQELTAQTAPLQAQAQAQHAQTLAQQAFRQYESGNPDARKLAGEMMQVAESSPHLLGILNGNDVEAMQEVFDYLYTKAEKQTRGRDADTLAEAAAARTAEQKETARQMKENAAVGSATATKEPQAKTGVDAWKESFHKVLFDDSTSIRSGLTTD